MTRFPVPPHKYLTLSGREHCKSSTVFHAPVWPVDSGTEMGLGWNPMDTSEHGEPQQPLEPLFWMHRVVYKLSLEIIIQRTSEGASFRGYLLANFGIKTAKNKCG